MLWKLPCDCWTLESCRPHFVLWPSCFFSLTFTCPLRWGVLRSMLTTFSQVVRSTDERSQTRQATDVDLTLLLPIIGKASHVRQTNSGWSWMQAARKWTIRVTLSPSSLIIITRCWHTNDRGFWAMNVSRNIGKTQQNQAQRIKIKGRDDVNSWLNPLLSKWDWAVVSIFLLIQIRENGILNATFSFS